MVSLKKIIYFIADLPSKAMELGSHIYEWFAEIFTGGDLELSNMKVEIISMAGQFLSFARIIYRKIGAIISMIADMIRTMIDSFGKGFK